MPPGKVPADVEKPERGEVPERVAYEPYLSADPDDAFGRKRGRNRTKPIRIGDAVAVDTGDRFVRREFESPYPREYRSGPFGSEFVYPNVRHIEILRGLTSLFGGIVRAVVRHENYFVRFFGLFGDRLETFPDSGRFVVRDDEDGTFHCLEVTNNHEYFKPPWPDGERSFRADWSLFRRISGIFLGFSYPSGIGSRAYPRDSFVHVRLSSAPSFRTFRRGVRFSSSPIRSRNENRESVIQNRTPARSLEKDRENSNGRRFRPDGLNRRRGVFVSARHSLRNRGRPRVNGRNLSVSRCRRVAPLPLNREKRRYGRSRRRGFRGRDIGGSGSGSDRGFLGERTDARSPGSRARSSVSRSQSVGSFRSQTPYD